MIPVKNGVLCEDLEILCPFYHNNFSNMSTDPFPIWVWVAESEFFIVWTLNAIFNEEIF